MQPQRMAKEIMAIVDKGVWGVRHSPLCHFWGQQIEQCDGPRVLNSH